jgi:hypothetical protein
MPALREFLAAHGMALIVRTRSSCVYVCALLWHARINVVFLCVCGCLSLPASSPSYCMDLIRRQIISHDLVRRAGGWLSIFFFFFVFLFDSQAKRFNPFDRVACVPRTGSW